MKKEMNTIKTHTLPVNSRAVHRLRVVNLKSYSRRMGSVNTNVGLKNGVLDNAHLLRIIELILEKRNKIKLSLKNDLMLKIKKHQYEEVIDILTKL